MTSALAQRWRAAGAASPAIARCADGSPPPLSYAQERMWFLEQYAPGTATYHMWLPLRIAGPLDEDALEAALAALVARHESLRMRFPATVDGKPTVEVATPGPVPLTRLDSPTRWPGRWPSRSTWPPGRSSGRRWSRSGRTTGCCA
ncbi:condensation domain-containing protein [Phytohabitans rumicis]|uniref:Condensation domain-containing protein n=1 Tax=Phytohabitans rumicis TaxID=1076125 RepID=A0A6V8LHP0_9ACTN|nr:condensation domain-containing protein [Phytohabitans rumicis]GFJ94411.1 hypothetical protein Prum_080530 [Phytohabitans rumicis]